MSSRVTAAAPFVVAALFTAALGPMVKKVVRSRVKPFFDVETAKIERIPGTLTSESIVYYIEWTIDCYQASTVVLLPLVGILITANRGRSSLFLGGLYTAGTIVGLGFFLWVLSVEDPYEYVKGKTVCRIYSAVDVMSVIINVAAAFAAAWLI